MKLYSFAKCLAFSFAFLVPKATLANVYDYVQYQDPDEFALAGTSSRIDTDKKLFFANDDSSSIIVCKANDSFYCLFGNIFNFAVPKQSLVVGSKWTFRHFSYEVAGQRDLSLAGQRIGVYIISSRQVGSAKRRLPYVNTYFYSEKRGLIGIKTYYPKTRYAYFLLVAGENGFPK